MNWLFFALTIPVWIVLGLIAATGWSVVRWLHVRRGEREYRKFEAELEAGRERNRKLLDTIARYPRDGAA
jgi:Flp pilus assembly protein TadB